ncbi:hypothetical protein [Actinacidiphila soli]|jgi:hypothetical protein|uniref:hypothetical protein n=1 Tax=Actinacidiphila soli TaxID=2487275 RepID=UPI000FCC2DE5|nr:hypothetical protein [Actinacidiphila soli]
MRVSRFAAALGVAGALVLGGAVSAEAATPRTATAGASALHDHDNDRGYGYGHDGRHWGRSDDRPGGWYHHGRQHRHHWYGHRHHRDDYRWNGYHHNR